MSRADNESQRNASTDREFRIDLSQDEFDRDFFGRILKISDRNSDVLRRQAELLARSGDYGSALDLDLVLAERFSSDPVIHYNLTCSLSMTGHLTSALKTLRRAIELGYRDFAHIEADTDLDPLRDHPTFQEIIQLCAEYGIDLENDGGFC